MFTPQRWSWLIIFFHSIKHLTNRRPLQCNGLNLDIFVQLLLFTEPLLRGNIFKEKIKNKGTVYKCVSQLNPKWQPVTVRRQVNFNCQPFWIELSWKRSLVRSSVNTFKTRFDISKLGFSIQWYYHLGYHKSPVLAINGI